METHSFAVVVGSTFVGVLSGFVLMALHIL